MSTILTHTTKPVQLSPVDVAFLPQTSRLLVAGYTTAGSGSLQIYNLQGKDLTLVSEVLLPPTSTLFQGNWADSL